MSNHHPLAAPKAAVGANPDIASLIRATTNAATPAGLELPPPVTVGLVLRESPQGDPISPPVINGGKKAYLTATLDADFRASDIFLTTPTLIDDAGKNLLGNGLAALMITSWTSNGIRDQNLIAETGIPAIAFNLSAQRRFGFDVAPTDARQQIVIEIENVSDIDGVGVAGVLSGYCGDCNTIRRGA